MTKFMHGIVHGKTIELEQEPGLPDGQQAQLAIHVIRSQSASETWGEGLRRCAGALAGIPGLDEDIDQILKQRRLAAF